MLPTNVPVFNGQPIVPDPATHPSEWLRSYSNLCINEPAYDDFIACLLPNLLYMSRIKKNEFCTVLTLYKLETIISIKESISDCYLVSTNHNSAFIPKQRKKNSPRSIIDDIFNIIQIANKSKYQESDLLLCFDPKPTNINDQVVEILHHIKILTAQNETLKTQVNNCSTQNSTILQECKLLRQENISLKNDLVVALNLIGSLEKQFDKLSNKTDILLSNHSPSLNQPVSSSIQAPSITEPAPKSNQVQHNTFRMPSTIPPPAYSNMNPLSTPNSNKNPLHNQSDVWSKIPDSITTTPTTNINNATSNSSKTKIHNSQRQNGPKQKQLKTFDSTNPNSINQDIHREELLENNDQPFETVEPRKRRRKTFANSIGTGSDNTLMIDQKQSYIFISRISATTTNQQVNSYLEKNLIPKGINFSNLQEATLAYIFLL